MDHLHTLNNGNRDDYLKIQRFASHAVTLEVKAGRLPNLKITPTHCLDCSRRATAYDHRDYFQPITVQPVCRSCNSIRGIAQLTLDKLCSICNGPGVLLFLPLPSYLADQIKALAEQEQRSVNKQIIQLLILALQTRGES